MTVLPLLRVFAFAIAMSAIAPGILVLAGVCELDLLAIVFAPSVIVGAATAGFARRTSKPTSWPRDSTLAR